MKITLNEVVDILRSKDYFYILTHQYPDGDTLGSAYALCSILQYIGKKACVLSDVYPKKYNILRGNINYEKFLPQYIISVDVADSDILGYSLKNYSKKIDLSIDHHSISKKFAKLQYVEPHSAATSEIIYKIMKMLKVPIDKHIATCIYTGISTDTGCFKYSNATPRSYRIAADMLEAGIDANNINRVMFDTKTRSRLEIERMVLDNIEFYFNSKCAIIYVTLDMIKKSHANDSDLEGLASIPRQIEGVLVGITMRQKEDGSFKVSVRTDEKINSAKICEYFGGGGHQCASGCSLNSDLETAKKNLVSIVKKFI